VVSENENLIQLLTLLLPLEGFKTVAARPHCLEGGPDGVVDLLRRQGARIAAFDIPYPYESWWSAFEQVRQAPAIRHVQFVILTTAPMIVRAQAGIAGPLEIVEMPFELDELTRAIRRVLDGGTPEREGRRDGGAVQRGDPAPA
jgi:CheY-like chemotaxis protein